MTDYREAYLNLAAPEHAAAVRDAILREGDDAWAFRQAALLGRMDAYVEEELVQPAEHLINSHEAGGEWRIAFPHYRVRGDARIPAHLSEVMRARRRYAEAHLYHGFPDEAEVHHEIETFLYFQNPLALQGWQGSDAALTSLEDVAHHLGNWVGGVPAWYDWATHGFRSTWLGTRNVRAYAPFDYQEANHWRFVGTGLYAYLRTGAERYLALALDYAETWCAHIEARAEAGGPITCAILPAGAASEELGHAGKATDTSRYQIFYSTVAPNTAYEVAGGLLDLYRLTGRDRYLHCARLMMDQFFQNGRDGRPAVAYREGAWQHGSATDGVMDVRAATSQTGSMLVRPALRHDLVTGEARYRDWVLAWAGAIDERTTAADQATMDVLLAAHYYSGDASWLARAYAMDLRTWAVVEQDPSTHICNVTGRYGSRFVLELSYQPLLGGVDWGTRAGLPVERLRHVTEGREGLPEGLALRIWRKGNGREAFEAHNRGPRPASWIVAATPRAPRLAGVESDGHPLPAEGEGFRLEVAPGARVRGRFRWEGKERLVG